jgi:glutamyl-Q tRNA(Asp) synthetase
MGLIIPYPQIPAPADARDTVVTRFAPSPNGLLHIGHAYAAICAHDFARGHGGRFILRIEDIDGTRSRPEYIEAIIADILWLGLTWDGDVVFQSARIDSYHIALMQLREMGLVYRCKCTRGQIAGALKIQPVRHGPDGPQYPGTCREKAIRESDHVCWRLNMAAACARIGPLRWTDLVADTQWADPSVFGDIVLWRSDAPASYHLAATLDDTADGISHVVRGRDLLAYTSIHRLLQALLGLPTPLYWHHGLLLDAAGEKLAKSRASAALCLRRKAGENGLELADMLRMGVLPTGISL